MPICDRLNGGRGNVRATSDRTMIYSYQQLTDT